mgnify:CR=1 FL=1
MDRRYNDFELFTPGHVLDDAWRVSYSDIAQRVRAVASVVQNKSPFNLYRVQEVRPESNYKSDDT